MSHLFLHRFDALFVFGIHTLCLRLLSLDELSNFCAALLQILNFSIAVCARICRIPFNEIASSGFNKNICIVMHDAWNVERRCKRHHYLTIGRTRLHIGENFFAFQKFLFRLKKLLIMDTELLNLVFNCFFELNKLLWWNFRDIYFLVSLRQDRHFPLLKFF